MTSRLQIRRSHLTGRLGAAALTAVLVAACGTSTPTPPASTVASSSAGSPTPSLSASPAPSAASPGPAVGSKATFPLAVVAHETDLRQAIAGTQVAADLAAGRIVVPCGLSSISIGGSAVTVPSAACSRAPDIPAALAKTPGLLGLLPAGLVDPRVKVLQVDGADLFGDMTIRAKPYPVIATSDDLPADLAGSATVYDANDVRTIVSTGDTCPDRAPSHWANVVGKGWDWTLKGGTARYTRVVMDRQFSGPTGNGWPVVQAVRTGQDTGAIWDLIHDADIAVNDFECPMIAGFTQHDHGTLFTIDPRVAGLFQRVGMDFASLGSNHGTDLGASGIRQTLAYFDQVGVKYSGAGMDLAQSMKPAVFDVRGLRFAFISWDATGVSHAATATGWGELHPTADNVRNTVALARSQADLVILMPQWNFPEYSAPFTRTALAQRDAWYAAGVDDILGSGTHWASAMSVTRPDPARGWRVAVTSHGNFLFGQLWSRQTQEGLIYEVTFRGTQLVQVRVHPYIVMDGAQPNLTDPTTDGAYVQQQMLKVSQLP
ncbi:MAG TPA: CapA family protein [Candidatus Dormibacteraeota bacterium]|nr:CapA family protein [Candidatus Dormibacteraeota bacterium]